MTTAKTIKTKLEDFGFHHTVADQLGEEIAERSFDSAARELMSRFGYSADQARRILDSTNGRHMADVFISDGDHIAEFAKWKRSRNFIARIQEIIRMSDDEFYSL